MKYEIKNRWTGNVQFVAEIEADESTFWRVKIGLALKWAVENKTVLRGADLRGADLRGADLRGAVLSGAVLRGAVLSDADLSDADLRGAVLSDADLRGAVLSDADLSDADLSDADLSDADLRGADLRGADLRGAVLSDAVLSDIKQDFFARLALAKAEVSGLYDYLMRGRINGSVYEGECACFCGTIAKVRHEPYALMTNGLKPDCDSATERWFLAIQKGDTPDNSQVSAITAQWLREFMAENDIAVPKYKLISSAERPDLFEAA